MLRVTHRELLFNLQNGCCWLCGQQIEGGPRKTSKKSQRPMGCSIDHVRPRSLGGTDSFWNKLVAHTKCNNDRGSDPPSPEAAERALEVFRNAEQHLPPRHHDSDDILAQKVNRGRTIAYLERCLEDGGYETRIHLGLIPPVVLGECTRIRRTEQPSDLGIGR